MREWLPESTEGWVGMVREEDGEERGPSLVLPKTTSVHEEDPLDDFGFTDDDRADMMRRKQAAGRAPEMPNCCSIRAVRPPVFVDASKATGDGVPTSYQNAGCLGCEASKGLYCTPTPADVDLPKLPLGFAYDFEPRGFGYPSEKLGPPTPLECCAQCVCCQLCGQLCEPSCCDQGMLAASMATLPKGSSDIQDMMDWSCMDCLNLCQFMPCFPIIMSTPGCGMAAPCLETCGICGPCDWTKTSQSCFDCMPCVEHLARGQVPCFFSCWYSTPCNFRCRPCIACQGIQLDPVGCCRGWSCHCYRSACLPACFCCCCTKCCGMCKSCPQCPRCPRIPCPGFPNCCCCLEGFTQTTQTSCVLCPGIACCGCLCRNHAGCHPCCAKCHPCCMPVKRNPGGVWLSPYDTLDEQRGTNGNFFYNKQTDFIFGIDAIPAIDSKHFEKMSPRKAAEQAVAAEMVRCACSLAEQLLCTCVVCCFDCSLTSPSRLVVHAGSRRAGS